MNENNIYLLQYNKSEDRYGIWDVMNHRWYHDGLHCGTGLDVLHNGEWVGTCIEWGGGRWVLMGTPYSGDKLQNLQVRP